MKGEQGKGKRRLKRLRLEAAVEHAEKERLEHQASGVVWTGVTKAALQKQAEVGKNYIDMLHPDDGLAKRIKPLLRRAETTRAKRDVEQTRLQRIRELEKWIALQAKENQVLMSELNRTRGELERIYPRLEAFERHYADEGRAKRGLMSAESNNSSDVIDFPKGRN